MPDNQNQSSIVDQILKLGLNYPSEEGEPFILWLPAEILIEIFLLATKLEGFDFPKDQHFHATPVAISHVCQRWRDIALSIPNLWANLCFSATNFDPTPLENFLDRAGSSKLTWFYRGKKACYDNESSNFDVFQSIVWPHLERVELISWRFHNGSLMHEHIMQLFSPPLHIELCSLQDLDLGLPVNTNIRVPTPPSVKEDLPCSLRHIRLCEVNPILLQHVFAPSSLQHLTSFELTSEPKNLSTICKLLTSMRSLEELVLGMSTFVSLDVQPNEGPVLEGLKKFEWRYPSSRLFQHVMSVIQMPKLTNCDVWFEMQCTKHTRVIDFGRLANITFHSVTDLVITMAADEDTNIPELFASRFPSLERFELAHVVVDGPPSKPKPPSTRLPIIPRLESLLYDPRLSCLTHFSLSRWRFILEENRTQNLFGYMPMLIGLSLDACEDVGVLLTVLQGFSWKSISSKSSGKGGAGPCGPQNASPGEALGQSCGQQGTPVVTRRRIVRVCPRLETLAFWNCGDLEVEALRRVIQVRNGGADKDIDGFASAVIVEDLDRSKNKAKGKAEDSQFSKSTDDNVKAPPKLMVLEQSGDAAQSTQANEKQQVGITSASSPPSTLSGALGPQSSPEPGQAPPDQITLRQECQQTETLHPFSCTQEQASSSSVLEGSTPSVSNPQVQRASSPSQPPSHSQASENTQTGGEPEAAGPQSVGRIIKPLRKSRLQGQQQRLFFGQNSPFPRTPPLSQTLETTTPTTSERIRSSAASDHVKIVSGFAIANQSETAHSQLYAEYRPNSELGLPAMASRTTAAVETNLSQPSPSLDPSYVSSSVNTTATSTTTMAMGGAEAFSPVPITYIRISGCKLVGQHDTETLFSLKELYGMDEITWNPF